MKKITTYLICLETPIVRKNGVQVRHYIGSTNNLKRRITEHRKGKAANGSPLLDLANRKDIKWHTVRIWKTKDRQQEQWLKQQKNAKKFCPCCNKEIPF